MRGVLVAVATLLVLGSLVALAVLLAQAQQDAEDSAERRFSERAQISAALTQSVFSALGGASGKELERRYGGARQTLAGRLTRQLPESRVAYLAVVDASGRTLASAGRPPRRLALAAAARGGPALSDVVGAARAKVIEYAIPFGPARNRRALVQGVPLALMTSFLDNYLLRLHQVDRAGLALTDRGGVTLTRMGRIGRVAATSPDRLTTRAAVPGTPWTLRLEAPRDLVFASVNHFRWLPWLLLAALAIAAITGVWLLRRVLASARRQREANLALHESRDQIHNLVDALEEGVALHHADGRTELLNASAKQLVDSEGGVLNGLPPDWELLDEAGTPLAADETPVKRALHSGAACSEVVALQHPDGSRRWLKVRARPLVRADEDRPHAVVASWTDVTEQREMELHLTDLAQRDPLTGLWNRRRFEEDLERQLARRDDERAALLVLDLDNFKQVNDTLGHLAGDDVLRTLADGLRRRLRGSDSAARIGGDEFALLLPGLGAEEARAMATDVATRLTAFVHDQLDRRMHLSLSIGVTVLDGDTQEVPKAFAAADEAMYSDKRRAGHSPAGGNGYNRTAAAVLGGEGAEARRPAPELSSLRVLLTAVQARDSYTARHSRQVVTLARAVADRLGLDEAETAVVEGAALLHDLGKIAVPDAILRKGCALADHEWALMRQHPVVGAQMVASIAELEHLGPAIRAEHERWDGRGYPEGLAGEAIPLASRITFVCDAYHAMTSDRPYRRALSHAEAVDEIARESGRQFCPSAAGALLEVLRAREAERASAPATAAPQVVGAGSGRE